MADQSLFIKINGSAKGFQAAVDKAKEETKDLEKTLAQSAKVSSIAFAALAASAVAAVSSFSKFEDGFTNVVTLLDESSFQTKSLSRGIQDLSDDILTLGASSGESFESLNAGLFDLVSAGVPAEAATSALASAVDLARAGATDTATSVKALTAALTAYGDEAGSADAIAEKFFTAQKFGVTTVAALSREFNKIGGLAKNLGISFDEALASSTALTANGAKPAAQAFTEYRAVLVSAVDAQKRLKGQTEEVQRAFSLQNIRAKGLKGALDELNDAVGGDVVKLKELLGSSEAVSAAISLTGQQSELTTKILKELGNETTRATTFQDALAVKNETVSVAFNKFLRTVESLAISFGSKLAPATIGVLNGLTSLLQTIREFPSFLGTVATKAFLIVTSFAGITAGASILGLGIVKLRTLFIALSLSMRSTGFAAKTMWASITLGASLAISFLPEIISGFKALFKLFDKGDDSAKKIRSLNQELEFQKNLLKELKEDTTSGIDNSDFIAKTEERIKALEKEKAAKEALITESNAKEIRAENKKNETLARIAENQAQRDRERAQRLRDEQLLLEEQQELEDLERQQAFLDIANSLDEENRANFNQKELDDLLNQVKTKSEVQKDFRKSQYKAETKRRNQYLEDEIRFGKNLADFRSFVNSEEVQGAKTAAQELSQLQNSKNKELKAIGKAAALVNIAISTQEGAIKAYSSLAGIPIVGPALGAAAAAALVAYGAERTANVAGLNRGGFVPGAGNTDTVPALLTPGELVVPKEIAPSFMDEVAARGAYNDYNAGPTEIVLTLRDSLSELIEAEFNERENLNISIRNG